MEITKNVSRWGNSAGILLPKEWMGKEARIILIDRTSEARKEVFAILDSCLEDISGIYLVGSYSRGEERKSSDIDIVVISRSIRKELVSGKYHISIIPLESIRKALEKNPLSILPRLNEARPILNSFLLEELKSIKLNKGSFKNFIEETKRMTKINRKIIELDKLDSDFVSTSVIYSLILRLRGIFIVKGILEKKNYSNKLFLNWLKEETKEKNVYEMYDIYTATRDNRKVKTKIRVESAEKLLKLLEKEAREW